MKRIALCLHGQPRGIGMFLGDEIPAIEYQNRNLIKREDVSVDVFFHTWDYSNKIENLHQRLIHMYSPKAFAFESPLSNSCIEKYRDGHTPPNYVYSNYCQYHSIYACDIIRQNYEVENSFSYDWVIATIFDVALNIVLDFQNMDSAKIYQSDFNMSTYNSNGFKVPNPVFGVGNSENMKKYCAMLPNIEKLLAMCSSIDGHAIFGANLKNQGIVDNMMPLDMCHPFPPRGRDASPNSFVRNDYHIFCSI